MKDYRDQSKDVLQDMAGYVTEFLGMSADNRPERLLVSFVTGNYFSMLGVQPEAGRLILPNEGEIQGADPVLVLGYSYWKRRFGGDQGVVGKPVLVNGQPFTIVGVVPEKFLGTYTLLEMDAYVPMGMLGIVQNGMDQLSHRDRHGLHAIARLKPGVTPAQAEATLQVVANRLTQKYPDTNEKTTIHAIPERLARPEEDGSSQIPAVAGIFLGLVGLVLLLACVNVANILLARSSLRRRELAIRVAIGARRDRLIRQLLTESAILAVLAGGVGIALGVGAVRLIASVPLGIQLPLRLDFTLDWRVLLYAVGMTFLAAVLAGGLPALRASRQDVNSMLREGSRGSTGGREHHRLRNVLVGLQVAVSVMLLVTAALFAQSFVRSHAMDLGFDPHGIMNADLEVQFRGYDEAQGRAFYRELLQKVRSLPGVEGATLALSVPMGFSGARATVELPGQATGPKAQRRSAMYNAVEPNYFQLMRIPLLKGRAIAETDSAQVPRVAVINDTMAGELWPGQDPIGKLFSMQGRNGVFTAVEVVGLVKTGKYTGLDEDPTPFFYVASEQNYFPMRTLQLRSSLPPDTLGPMIVKAVRDLDANLPIYDLQTMDQLLAGANGFLLFKLGACIAGALGLLGLTLAVVGVYGVVNYIASRRTHEIGLRMALGAAPRDILAMVLRGGLGVVLAGTFVGIAGALGFSRLLASMLVGVRTYDPPTYAAVAVLLSAVALLACWMPARRAMRVDPLVALRYE
jgi:putative ABC transport system permease protein